MYEIKQRNKNVLEITFSGFIKAEEMQKWLTDSREVLKKTPKEFGVIINMTQLKTLPAESKSIMEEGQKLYKQKGMVRSAVILSSTIITAQFKKIAKDTGIDKWERYFDQTSPSWQIKSLNWVEKGIEP